VYTLDPEPLIKHPTQLVAYKMRWTRTTRTTCQLPASSLMHHLDRGSSAKVEHSCVRELSDMVWFGYVWPPANSLLRLRYTIPCTETYCTRHVAYSMRWQRTTRQLLAPSSMHHLDRGSSVKVEHSYLRELSDMIWFEYMRPPANSLLRLRCTSVCTETLNSQPYTSDARIACSMPWKSRTRQLFASPSIHHLPCT